MKKFIRPEGSMLMIVPGTIAIHIVVVVSNGSDTHTHQEIKVVEIGDEPPHYSKLIKFVDEAIERTVKSLPNSNVVAFSHMRLD